MGKAKKVILLGLGTEGKDKDTEGLLSKIGAILASKCDAEKQVSTCAPLLPSTFSLETFMSKSIQDTSSSFYSALYSDNRYRTKSNIEYKAKNLKSVAIVVEGGVDDNFALSNELDVGKKLAKGVYLTKDIV